MRWSPSGRLLEEVWNQPYGGGERTVDVHLSWLRRKLGETAAHPVYLHSVRGVGVRLAPPSDDTDAGDADGGAPDAGAPDADDAGPEAAGTKSAGSAVDGES